MSNKKDRKRKECINSLNERAPFSCLATGLGSNRASIETRQEAVENNSEEAVEDIMSGIESLSSSKKTPEDACEEVKMTIREVLEVKMPDIIDRNMAKLKARNTIGTSMLDEPTLGYTEDLEIKIFLENLGVDLDNKSDLLYAKKIFAEAFVRLQTLLRKEKVAAHRKIIPNLHPAAVKKVQNWFLNRVGSSGKTSKKLTTEEQISYLLEQERAEKEFIEKELAKLIKKEDILKFFKVAAGCGPKQKGLAKQACALLRIGYAIDYIERDPQISLLEEALGVLLDKKEKHFVDKRARGERIWKYKLGQNRLHMPIERLEVRTKKRSRIITKLLHKPGNRSGKVLDHIGVRVTTKSAIDTLKLIYYMFFNVETQMFPYMSIRIDETKNLILDANRIEEIIDDDEQAQDLVDMLSKETIDHDELSDVLASDEVSDDTNKFSSPIYKAIHIIVDLPINSPKFGRVSFPVEVQILDKKSHFVNEHQAPHAGYEQLQTDAVIDRVVHRNNIEAVLDEKSKGKRKSSTLSQKSLSLDSSKM
jgi:uncharacterized protein (TIGR04562 family)